MTKSGRAKLGTSQTESDRSRLPMAKQEITERLPEEFTRWKQTLFALLKLKYDFFKNTLNRITTQETALRKPTKSRALDQSFLLIIFAVGPPLFMAQGAIKNSPSDDQSMREKRVELAD